MTRPRFCPHWLRADGSAADDDPFDQLFNVGVNSRKAMDRQGAREKALLRCQPGLD